jgi:hypothetical protein
MTKEKFILKNETPEKRLEYLESTADQVVKEKYYQRLTGDQLTIKKAEFTANALNIEDLEEQKKEVMDEFKDKIQPLKDSNKILSSEIRTGFTQKEGKLYMIIDHKTRMVNYYDETGEMIETKTRPATADELQNTTIHMSLRTGTNY